MLRCVLIVTASILFMGLAFTVVFRASAINELQATIDSPSSEASYSRTVNALKLNALESTNVLSFWPTYFNPPIPSIDAPVYPEEWLDIDMRRDASMN